LKPPERNDEVEAGEAPARWRDDPLARPQRGPGQGHPPEAAVEVFAVPRDRVPERQNGEGLHAGVTKRLEDVEIRP